MSAVWQLAAFHDALHSRRWQRRATTLFSENYWATDGKLTTPPHPTAGAREAIKKQTPEMTIKSSKVVKREMAGGNAYYVNIKLGSLEVVALIDTGAMVTTLNAEVLDRCADLKKILQPCILSHVVGMGEWSIDILGEIQLPLDLGPVSLESQRMVITECDGGLFPFVLGLNFLDAYGLQIDTIRRQLCYTKEHGQGVVIPLQVSFSEMPAETMATACRRITIHGRTFGCWRCLLILKVFGRDAWSQQTTYQLAV